jgi:Na+/alanine symporter
MILSMAFPNIIGAVMLSGKIKRALDDYMNTLNTTGFKRFK